MGRRAPAKWVSLCAVGALLSGCGADGGRDELVVFAAASLGDAIDEIAVAFEAARDDVEVTLSTAGSSALREQILDGAPAAVFASANEDTMAAVVDAGETSTTPTVFATNELALAVPSANPGDVTALDDLERDELFVGVCAVGVPCGDFARQLLSAAGVDASIDTDEPDVRALLTKLDAEELDAGIVYATDVQAADGAVVAIDVDDASDVVVEYPIAALRHGDPELRAAFVDFVLGPQAQEILVRHGFGTP